MARAILLPFDGSKHSFVALTFTLENLLPDDTLHLLNVQSPTFEAFETTKGDAHSALSYEEKGRQLLAEAEKIVTEAGRAYVATVRIGIPTLEIIKQAKSINAQMIIMGSRGMGPVVGKALGSISYGVLHLTPCPLLIVPHPTE